jgi:ubiquinone/menaquinone biosynthesis C-methylase UbiE
MLMSSFSSSEAKVWDSLADNYDRREHDAVYMAAVAAVARRLDPRPGERIFDAGCGTGLPLCQYLRAGISVTAVDLSVSMLARLRAKFPGGSLQFIKADLSQLPFPDGYFDRVLSANVLNGIPTPDLRSRCIAELARVLKPGGRFVVSVHNWSRRRQLARTVKEGIPAGADKVPYIYRFTEAEFRVLLETSFKVLRLFGAGLPFLPYEWKLSTLSSLVERAAQRFSASARYADMLVGVCTTEGISSMPPAERISKFTA